MIKYGLIRHPFVFVEEEHKTGSYLRLLVTEVKCS